MNSYILFYCLLTSKSRKTHSIPSPRGSHPPFAIKDAHSLELDLRCFFPIFPPPIDRFLQSQQCRRKYPTRHTTNTTANNDPGPPTDWQERCYFDSSCAYGIRCHFGYEANVMPTRRTSCSSSRAGTISRRREKWAPASATESQVKWRVCS